MSDKLTPEEFRDKMVRLYDKPRSDLDIDTEHEEADRIMCQILAALGYGAGVMIFREAPKWYS